MKRIQLLTGMFVIALTLVACGANNNDDINTDQDSGTANNEDQQNNADDNTSADQDTDEDATNQGDDNVGRDMQAKMDELDYTDFELEVDYGKNKEYEAKIEQDNGKTTADLEDEINGEDLIGEEAFNKIHPNVKKLTIDQGTDKQDALKQVLDAFDLDTNYKKFEMEITFKDGTKIEYEDHK